MMKIELRLTTELTVSEETTLYGFFICVSLKLPSFHANLWFSAKSRQ